MPGPYEFGFLIHAAQKVRGTYEPPVLPALSLDFLGQFA